MELAYSWVRNIVIYMLLNTIIMNLLGNKSYKKYVSIVSGMILVMIVISPLMKLLQLDEKLDYYLQANDFSVETSEFKNDLSKVEEEQRDQIFSGYEDKIRQQTKELLLEEGVYLKSLHLNINQDVESSSFGEILSMDITATAEENTEQQGNKRLRIDEIEIADITLGKQKEDDGQEVPSPLEINIKSKLADFYNIEQGNINISVQGG